MNYLNCPLCHEKHRYIDCPKHEKRHGETFQQIYRCPLYLAIMAQSKWNGKSKIVNLTESIDNFGQFHCYFDKFDAIEKTMKRIVRDSPMHIMEYEEALEKFGCRYQILRDASLTSRGLYPKTQSTIGFVTLIDGRIKFFGSEFIFTAMYDVLREARVVREKELSRKKYKGLTKQELIFQAVLIETKEFLNGKARLLRTQGINRTNQRAGINGAAVNANGCGN